jgi:hypothetical protein
MDSLNLSDRRRHAVPEPNGSLFKIKWETILQWVIAALVAWNVAWSTVNARVAVLESQVNMLNQQLNEIRSDVKQLLRRP